MLGSATAEGEGASCLELLLAGLVLPGGFCQTCPCPWSTLTLPGLTRPRDSVTSHGTWLPDGEEVLAQIRSARTAARGPHLAIGLVL